MFQLVLYYVIKTLGKLGLAVLFVWLLKELSMGICKCSRTLENNVIVITGTTSGLGLETALQLAKRGAKIILGCRNLTKGNAVKIKIETEVPNVNVTLLELDLASLKSISKFVSMIEDLTSCVHILVNNAGQFLIERDKQGKFVKKHTQDGFELVMGTNYFGHFYLTHQMLDLLKNGGTPEEPSRIVNLSSFGHIAGVLNGKELDCNR